MALVHGKLFCGCNDSSIQVSDGHGLLLKSSET
jgi:hypothetical protein